MQKRIVVLGVLAANVMSGLASFAIGVRSQEDEATVAAHPFFAVASVRSRAVRPRLGGNSPASTEHAASLRNPLISR